MSFLNPAGLWGLLGIPVLILIYIIKPKFQEKLVTSTFIWKLSQKYKKKYSDATHNVWAYLIKNGNLMRYTDDGEPSGTSGIPVLDVIRKGGFTDAVIVVTRYFGGTLLGTGGLVRAYSAAAKAAVDDAGLASFSKFDEIIVETDYQMYQKLKNYLKHPDVIVDETEFSGTVMVKIAVFEESTESVCKDISEMSAGRAVIEKIGQRLDQKRESII